MRLELRNWVEIILIGFWILGLKIKTVYVVAISSLKKGQQFFFFGRL